MSEFIEDRLEYHVGREEAKKLRQADESLKARPKISVRLRIIVGFLLCFLLTGATALTSLAVLYRARSRAGFLATTARITALLSTARPPVGTGEWSKEDLKRAWNSTNRALDVFRDGSVVMIDTKGVKSFSELSSELSKLSSLMDERFLLSSNSDVSEALLKRLDSSIADQQGHVLTIIADDAGDVSTDLDKTLRSDQILPFIFLFLLLLLILWIARLLATTITRSIKRFQEYTQRIASGDFSPIQPAKRYQDEFSDLALATNRMLYELRAREAQLIKTGKLATMGCFTSGVINDLGGPLDDIQRTAESLMEKCRAQHDSEKEEMLDLIYEGAGKASERIRVLVDFIREKPSVGRSASVPEVVESAATLLRSEMNSRKVVLKTEIPTDLPRVMIEPNQFRQVLLNLLLNSIQAMPDGGEVRIGAWQTPNRDVRIELSDDGTGISPEDKPFVLDPFFTTRASEGASGIGLTISYAVLKKFGGELNLESLPGKGTTVYFRIPSAGESGDQDIQN